MNFTISNVTYDRLKPLVQIFLPALATLYFTLAAVWNLPHADAVVATLAALAAFLGSVLGISAKGYSPTTDGTLIVVPTPGESPQLLVELESPPNNLENGQDIVFRVSAPVSPS